MTDGKTVFISYRRGDSAGWAGRLETDLCRQLGPDTRVFMDVDGIPAGSDFARYIDATVGSCDALLAVIGPGWLKATDEQGLRRLDDPSDFVRLEIEAALRRGIPVIPTLVDAVPLPRHEELPPSLAKLTTRQAVQMDNRNWEAALNRLVRDVGGDLSAGPPRLVPSTSRLDFGVLRQGQELPRRTVLLRNEGGGELQATVSTRDSWIIARLRSDTIDVLIDTAYEGEYQGSVVISSAGGTAKVAVSAVVQAAGDHTPVSTPPQPPWGTTETASSSSARLTRDIPTHMVMAIFALVLFFPTGIPAIVAAARVSSLRAVGNMQGASSASARARVWAIVSFCLFGLFIVISIASSPSDTSGY